MKQRFPGGWYIEGWKSLPEGGHKDEADLERTAARELSLWANAYQPGTGIGCVLYVALGCANVHPNVTAATPVDHTARCAFENASGIFVHNNNTFGIYREENNNV